MIRILAHFTVYYDPLAMWQPKNLKSVVISFVIFCGIIISSISVIAYGRGYRPDFKKNTIKPTGLLSATSDPVGSQVFIDGKLKTATNNATNVEPGWYTVRIAKDSYISWEKKLRIQGEVVTRADAFLFPSNPSLSPLTTTGIQQPTLSPDGTKIAFTVPLSTKIEDGSAAKRAGLWILDLADRPLGRNRDPQLIGASEESVDLSKGTVRWSPDSEQIMLAISPFVRLYTVAKPETFQDVSNRYISILSEWESERFSRQQQILAGFKQPIIDLATSSAKILAFSPDETKILYEATASATIPNIIVPELIGTNPTEEQRTISPNKLYVYDSREDKNFFVLDKKEIPSSKIVKPTPQSVAWFPTNRHLVLVLPGKIDIMEYDRTNWITVYSGPFSGDFLAPWTNGSRLVILTNLNPNAGSLPNLYTVNLR